MVARRDRSGAIAALFPDIHVDQEGSKASFLPQIDHEGQPGWVQGGFVATVLDYVCAHAATTAFGAQAITGNLSVRYGAPVLIDAGHYMVQASVVSGLDGRESLSLRRSLRVNGSMCNADGECVVTASGLFIRRRPAV